MLKTNKTDHNTTTFFLQFATRIIWRYAMSPIDAVTNKLGQTFFSRFSVFRNTSFQLVDFQFSNRRVYHIVPNRLFHSQVLLCTSDVE